LSAAPPFLAHQAGFSSETALHTREKGTATAMKLADPRPGSFLY
jgi:hypothetical protein